MTGYNSEGWILPDMAQNPFHSLDQRYGILYPAILNYHNREVFLKEKLKNGCICNVRISFVKYISNM